MKVEVEQVFKQLKQMDFSELEELFRHPKLGLAFEVEVWAILCP